MDDARRRGLHTAARLLIGFPLLSSAGNVAFWAALCQAGGNQQVGQDTCMSTLSLGHDDIVVYDGSAVNHIMVVAWNTADIELRRVAASITVLLATWLAHHGCGWQQVHTTGL